MIVAGRGTCAESAAVELREALRGLGVVLPVAADSRVWDCPRNGPVRLVEVGVMVPEVALEIAKACRQDAAGLRAEGGP